MLLGTDILTPEEFVINPAKRFVTIGACDNMVAPITVTKDYAQMTQHRMVRVSKTTVVPPHTRRLIPIRTNNLNTLSPDTDYRFVPKFNRSSAHLALHGMFPEWVVDVKTSTVVAYYNNSDHDVTVRASATVGDVLGPQNQTTTPPIANSLLLALFPLWDSPSMGQNRESAYAWTR